MKFYKLLLLTVLSCFALSCSQDKFEDETKADSSERLAASQFDDSYLGVYKGLFSTNDGLMRGSVVVTLSPTNEAVAQVTLSSGEMIELVSSKVKLTANNSVSNLRFSSAGLSPINATLDFSVDGNGLNPSISNVMFDNKESDILIAKNLSRVPLVPITGTYDCTDCASQGVGFPNNRTWNIMSIGAGNNQNFATQISFDRRIYTSVAANNSQNGCVNVVNFSVCGIAGSSVVLGEDVTWIGTHVYESSDALACSSVNGNWNVPDFGPGISGTFQSDSDCNTSVAINDLCGNALSIECSDSVSGSTTPATNSDGPASCGTSLNTAKGVWYTYTALADGNVTVDTFGSTYDTKLGVFSGDCGALVCVGGNDDFGSLQSQVAFAATSGETYFVYVTGFNTSAGNYILNVSCN